MCDKIELFCYRVGFAAEQVAKWVGERTDIQVCNDINMIFVQREFFFKNSKQTIYFYIEKFFKVKNRQMMGIFL